MILQGFETRQVTDSVITPFVESAKGIIHKRNGPSVGQYQKTQWPTFSYTYQNMKASEWVVFGVLRGTGDLIKQCQKEKRNFYYFDHAYYFKEQKHGRNPVFGDRIYRLTKNLLSLNYIDKLDEIDYNRIRNYQKHIRMKPFKKEGKYILVLPPSDHMKVYYMTGAGWEDTIVNTLKKYTDREIKIRIKGSITPLLKDIRNAWAVVSFQTTAAVDALIEGVPSFCDEISCAKPVSYSLKDLSEIEQPFYPVYRKEWLDSLLANQYTLKEIENGVAWGRVSAR